MVDLYISDKRIGNNIEHSEYELAYKVGIGRKAAYRELNVLWGVGLVHRTSDVWEDTFGNQKERVKWCLNIKHHLNIELIKKNDLMNLEVKEEKI
jgi:hypothetical protein